MNENTHLNQLKTYRIAGYCALVSALFIVAGLVWLLVFPQPAAQSSLSERLHFIGRNPLNWVVPFYCLIVISLLQLPIGMAFYRITRQENSFFAHLGSILGFMSMLIILQKSFILVSAIPRMARLFTTTQDELLKYSNIANFNSGGLIQLHSFSFSEIVLGISLLGGACFLFGLSLIRALKFRGVVGWLLLLTGVFSFIGLIGYLGEIKIVQAGTLLQLLLYFSTLLVLFPLFQQEIMNHQPKTGKS